MTARSHNNDDNEMAEMSSEMYSAKIYNNQQSRSRNSTKPRDQTPQPRYLSNLSKGITTSFYINGDLFFPSKKVVYNPAQFKDFNNYMDYLREKLEPRFGAVRKICTPNHGSRILGLGEMQEEGVYVVAGNEKFKPYRYDQITQNDRMKSQPFNYDADVVYHNRQYISSGKIKKCDTHSILIKVWPNGGDLKGPRRVLITPRVKPYTLSNVISHVNEMLKEDCVGTVEKLYFLSGSQVSDVDQIIQNGQYVACRKTERFKKARYNEQAVKNLAISPRMDRKLLPPLLPRSVNSMSQSSTENSHPSTQNSFNSNSYRRRGADGDDDRIFQAKPGKHPRETERVRAIDLDKDQSGLYRAKQNNSHTRGAKEVTDSRHVKTDLPVDMWDVKEVDEERITGREARKSTTKIKEGYRGGKTHQDMSVTNQQKYVANGRNKGLASNDRSDEINKAAAKIQAGYRGYQSRKRLNSLASQTDQGHNKNYKNDNAKKFKSDVPNRHQEEKPTAIKSKGQKVGELNGAKSQAGNREHLGGKQLSSNERLKEEEKAAIKIQAGFRGYQSRKRIDEKKVAATKIQSGIRGHQDRQQLDSSQKENARTDTTKRDEKDQAIPKLKSEDKGHKNSNRRPPSIREDSYDDEESKAAVTIQSHYRGYRARQGIANQRLHTAN